MATLLLTRRAKADLLSIGAYTKRTWGAGQAERYLDEMERCLRMLAEMPTLGRECGWIRTELRRFEKGKHVVFFRRNENGHDSVLPAR